MPKPESLAPGEGPRIEMTVDQLAFIQRWAAENGAALVGIEDRGEGYLVVAARNRDDVEVGRRTVFPQPGS